MHNDLSDLWRDIQNTNFDLFSWGNEEAVPYFHDYEPGKDVYKTVLLIPIGSHEKDRFIYPSHLTGHDIFMYEQPAISSLASGQDFDILFGNDPIKPTFFVTQTEFSYLRKSIEEFQEK